jgi:hypothetical protein
MCFAKCHKQTLFAQQPTFLLLKDLLYARHEIPKQVLLTLHGRQDNNSAADPLCLTQLVISLCCRVGGVAGGRETIEYKLYRSQRVSRSYELSVLLQLKSTHLLCESDYK